MASYDNFVDIRKRRPLFNEHTALKDIPIEWLMKVEPKIVRKGFKGCWISYAYTDQRGCPQIKMRRPDGTRYNKSLARYVMSIFYDFPESYYVRRVCPYVQCVNPNHLFISPHWKQE